MKKTRSLKSKVGFSIALAVLITVFLISILANLLLKRQFMGYVSTQQQDKLTEIVASLGEYYSEAAGTSGMGRGHHGGRNASGIWDTAGIEKVGTYALYEGVIIEVTDLNGYSVWDAMVSNESMCRQIMSEKEHHGSGNALQKTGVTIEEKSIFKDGVIVGSVSLSYYGPYYLSESDSGFLASLNQIIFGVGAISLIISLILGVYLASRISKPIINASDMATKIADGNYKEQMPENETTTEVQQLVASVNHLAKSLEKQEALRKNLTGDVAHELRTPITTVSTHLEAMIDGVWEPTPSRLQSCYEELQRITTLVEDLEKLTRVESENLKLVKEEILLNELIDKVVKSFSLQVEEKQLEVTITGEDTYCTADKDRIYQVIHNLFCNAVKYTPPNGSISVSVAEEEDTVKIAVADSGIGIPEEDLPFILNAFIGQKNPETEALVGAGIGLVIVKSIVEAHGGTVFVEGREIGSRFIIELPK